MPLDPQAAALLADLPKDWYSDERYMLEQLRSRVSRAAAEQPCGCAAVDPTVQAWLLWETACPARSYSWGGPNGAPESNWGWPDMRSRPQLNRQEYNTTTKSGRAQASAAELEISRCGAAGRCHSGRWKTGRCRCRTATLPRVSTALCRQTVYCSPPLSTSTEVRLHVSALHTCCSDAVGAPPVCACACGMMLRLYFEHALMLHGFAKQACACLHSPGSCAEGLLRLSALRRTGGFVMGDLDSHDGLCRALASLSGCTIVAVDYGLAPGKQCRHAQGNARQPLAHTRQLAPAFLLRQLKATCALLQHLKATLCACTAAHAPVRLTSVPLPAEHRFPTAVDDALAAVQWVAQNAQELGIDVRRIAVAGDSAGGTLSAVVCLLAKRAGGPALAFQLLLYPRTGGIPSEHPSLALLDKGYALTPNDIRYAHAVPGEVPARASKMLCAAELPVHAKRPIATDWQGCCMRLSSVLLQYTCACPC